MGVCVLFLQKIKESLLGLEWEPKDNALYIVAWAPTVQVTVKVENYLLPGQWYGLLVGFLTVAKQVFQRAAGLNPRGE